MHDPKASGLVKAAATIKDQQMLDLSLMSKWFKQNFGENELKLAGVCIGMADGVPAYVHHVRMLAEFLNPNLADDAFENLAAAYLYLCAAYYSVDALHDGQKATAPNSPGYGTPSDVARLTLACSQRLIGFEKSTNVVDDENIQKVLSETLAEAARALEEEHFFRSSDHIVFNSKDEFFHLWARSNPFIFLADALSRSANSTLDQVLRRQLENFLYLTQLGDDLTDWREDYANSNWTPFLRKCRARIGHTPSIEELEKAILLNGLWEEELSCVISGLSNIAGELKDPEHNLFRSAITRRVNMAVERLTEFARIKAGSTTHAEG